MTDEAFNLIAMHEMTAATEEARIAWRIHERRCWSRFLPLPCGTCTRMELAFLATLRKLCDTAAVLFR